MFQKGCSFTSVFFFHDVYGFGSALGYEKEFDTKMSMQGLFHVFFLICFSCIDLFFCTTTETLDLSNIANHWKALLTSLA